MAKTWFITGTSSGFGRGLTERALQRGDRVAATLRKVEALDDLAARYPEQLWRTRLDVTDPAAITDVVDRAFAELGTIDVVVNNAGYALYCSVEEASDEQIRQEIDTNLLGSTRVIRAALPHLRAQGGGRILQLSTAGGQTTYPNFSYYHATKWAIEGFAQTVAAEVAPFNVMLTIIEPGATRTSFAALMVSAPIMPEYDRTPAGDTRRAVEDGSFAINGDPGKMVTAMVECVDSTSPPLRLALGADAYTDMRASLRRRLDDLESQEKLAMSMATDADRG